jgi:hypothetical protein
MRLTSPRADHLERIRDLIILIDRHEILGLSDFNRYLQERLDWKRGRRYHYRAALEDLGLAKLSDSYGWQLTPRGEQLAQVNNYHDFELSNQSVLNVEEKRIFAEILIAYHHSAYFLGLFMPFSEPPKTVEHFMDSSQWISFVSTKEGVIVTRRRESVNIALQQARAFRWTIKNWLKSAGLIDEFQTEPTKLIDARDTHVLFPIKTRLESVGYDAFRLWIEQIVQPRAKVARMSIPALMYRVCTQHYIPVRDFHEGIEALYRREPKRFRLEKISSVHFNQTYEKRIKNYISYPKVDGSYRGTFAIVNSKENPRNEG